MNAAIDHVTSFCASLHLAGKALQFYAAEHPRAVESLTALEQASARLLAERSRIAIAATKGTLMTDGVPIEPATPPVRGLARELEARQIGGFVMTQGVSARELTELVRILVMKPQQLASLGGPEEALRRAGAMHVRISRVRYEAVTEGEEVVWSKSVRRDVDREDVAGELANALQRYLVGVLNQRGAGETGPASVADAAGAGDAVASDPATIERLLASTLAAHAEVARTAPDESSAREVLQNVLATVDPALQLALLLNVEQLPDSPVTGPFRVAARTLAGEGEEAAAAATPETALSALTAALGESADGIGLLRGRVEQFGVSREQLDELLHIIGWDKLSADEKVHKLLDGENALDLPSDKLIAFIRELAAAHRHADVLAILERYASAFERDSYDLRQSATDVFAQVAGLIESPGLAPEVEQLVVRTTLTRCTREIDPRLHQPTAEAVANVIAATVGSGRGEAALRLLSRLESAFTVAPSEAPVRATWPFVVAALGERRRAASIVNQIVAGDAESVARNVLPLVVEIGGALAPAIIEALADEEDRNRRGRLVKALKAIGKPAFPALMEALHSLTWYVVRNALMVLGDIGIPAHVTEIGRKLHHGDPRVRRAAARALAKIGGPEAERDLAEALADRDTEMQREVLLCLGSMRAASAVPSVIHLAKARLMGSDEKLREVAIATLGQIGSDGAIEFLAELLRPKGVFNRESLPIRTAAANALAQAPGEAGRTMLQSVLASETDAASREMLTASLSRAH